jgi:uncharacterized protein
MWPPIRPFLTTTWRDLAMLNYAVEPALLKPYLPLGVELDDWNRQAYLSIVGTLFLDTRIFGLPIPFHRDFEEVNLRFYVRRKVAGAWRRGVVFIKELVPLPAVAHVARACYGENYFAVPMGHGRPPDSPAHSSPTICYWWRTKNRVNRIELIGHAEPMHPVALGTIEHFIAQRYWGYCGSPHRRTIEYHVEHAPWNTCRPAKATLDCDIAATYGQQFVDTLKSPPASAFIADGSLVRIYRPLRLRNDLRTAMR